MMLSSLLNKNTIIAAVSNLSTAYNLFVISIASVILENQYCGGPKGCPIEADTATTSCLLGAIFGQLSFGYIGDCVGRARAMQMTMAMSILGALVSAFAVPITSDPKSVFYFLAITRFILGVGVGGVYPLSATMASESASDQKSRGTTASLVFSMQGVGYLIAPVLALILVQLPGGNGNPKNPSQLGLSWRLLLGLGGLPGILLAPFKASETKAGLRQEANEQFDSVNGAASPRTLETFVAATSGGAPSSEPVLAAAPVTLCGAMTDRKYVKKIIGCAGGWFLFDITFYGNGLFQAPVLASIFNVSPNKTIHYQPIEGDIAHNRALQMIFIQSLALPGYFIAVCLMDYLGRRNIQLQGFAFMALTFFLLGIGFDWMEEHKLSALLLILYGLTFFFSNFGPNSTTFILPAETFPPEVRTTLNGFSAAMGKAGASLGSSTFTPMNELIHLPKTMLVCAFVALLGFLVTFFFVEDRRGLGMEGESQDEAPAQFPGEVPTKPLLEPGDDRSQTPTP